MPGYMPTPVQYPSLSFAALSPKGSFIQAFRFQPRRDGIDFRRFSAIDVEKVSRELDIATLQESINAVTFCNLDNERCPYCQQPVDPVLLKILKLAQLTIEYLLQCQEYLSNTVAQLEERLQESASEHQQTKHEMVNLAEEIKKLKEENKRRKKLIGTQQMLIQAGANNYHKCQLCDKAFMNYSYLQGHVERRHPEITQLERQRKKHAEQVDDGIEDLRNKLQKTQSQLETEREMDHQRRMQELEDAHRREENIKRDFETWKKEERIKLQNEMDHLRQQLLSQIEDITIKNAATYQDLESKKTTSSNLGELLDEEERQERQKIQKELWSLREEMKRQETEWKKKMKEIKRDHNSERSELLDDNNRLRASLSNDQRTRDEQFESTMQSMKSTIEKQKKKIKSKEQKIRELKASKEMKEVPQVAQLVLPVGGAKDESSEEEMDESLGQKMRRIDAVRRNPEFIRQFRPLLEETLMEKLESMGVKKGAKGIPSSTYKDLKALLVKQFQQKMKKYPDIEGIKAKLGKVLQKLVKHQRKSEDTLQSTTSQLSVQSPRSTQSIPPPEVTPRARNVQTVESYRSSQVPVPSPRTKGMASQSATGITNVVSQPPPRTPPFTSEDDASMLDRSPYHSLARKLTPTSQPISLVQKQAVEDSDDDDWSDSDVSPEKPSPRVVSFSRDTTNQGSQVQVMARSLERQLSRQREKPVGGIETVPSKLIKSSNPPEARKSQSWDDSDSEISSLEEVTDHLDFSPRKPQPAVNRSAESTGSHGTSIWSSNSAKGW
ncbi:cilium assembly protein DZIP1L [Pseudophryne corroboree]|uniref:cilium assembly protein DZIP1L n=1 Tax=Pseudophryne corroboree TaxID=495146 RepID=UPI003081230A